MSKHLFGLVVTHHGTAANNRGENEGNITTLQKMLWKGEVHSTVSAEAIRWAYRYYWQRAGLPVNREWDEQKNDHVWQDPKWLPWTDPTGKGKGKATFIDDDVMGFMLAEAGKTEGNDDEASKGKRTKGTCDKRRGPLELTRAVSLTPFSGDITFNAKSGEKGSTSLYGTEIHATRYQYGLALTPEALAKPERALAVVDAVVGLSEVAGNQARFLFDFSPESVIFRWTDDFAPRMLYGFEQDKDGNLSIQQVLARVAAGDIDPKELIVGGPIAAHRDVAGLMGEQAHLVAGVKDAAKEANARITKDLKLKK
jgi:CRISPR-associated protein Cst2